MKLPQSCELLSSCLAQMPIAVAMCDRNFSYLFTNERWLNLFNLDKKEAIGRSHSDRFGNLSPEWQEKAQLCLQGQLNECEVEMPISGKERSISVPCKMSPWRDENGQIGGIILCTTFSPPKETIPHTETQNPLILPSPGQLENFFQLSRDLLCIATFEGHFVQINPAWEEILGWTQEELKEKSFLDFVHPDDRENTRKEAEEITLGNDVCDFENRYRCKDGSYKWLIWKSRGLPTQGLIYATARDMTIPKEAEAALRESEAREREKAQQLEKLLEQLQKTQMQLVQSEKMSSLGQLVAGIAHEINNPVNFIYGNLTHATEYTHDILGLLELYADEYPKPTPPVQDEIEAIELDFLIDDLPKLLDSMKVGAERIYEIVRSLRNFSRLDESQMKLVNIHEGIDSTLLILQNRLKAKPEHPAIEIVKNYSQLPEVECYPGQLNQVFMNLLANAIDALDEKQEQMSSEELAKDPSRISISTSVINDTWVRITIADNGPGIEQGDVNQLFDPFFTTKPAGKGTGLGLAISHQIVVEKHQGVLHCNSQPGQGTEFTIELPLKQTL
ncbi:MAG: PAS domain-containing sensor histidine kinase [Halothece sp.]